MPPGTGQAINFLRPLARLRLNTARPAAELMRARKPWVRALLILLGWYVLFMSNLLYKRSQKLRPHPKPPLHRRFLS